MSHEYLDAHEAMLPPEDATEVKIPVTLAFHIGTLLAVTMPYEKGDQQAEELEKKMKLAARFNACTDDMFASDINHLVPVTMNPAELELIATSAITLSPGPDGEQSGARDFRNDELRYVRSLQRAFRLCGGKVDPNTIARLEAALH